MPSDQELDVPDSEDEWRKRLNEEQYHILREAGTEPPGSGEHLDTDDEGRYMCAGCGADLFPSETKYDADHGWPSFYAARDGAVEFRPDHSLGRKRTEVICARCDGHLGHVFDDGPEPTGKRFCINSAALAFDPET